MRQDQFFLQIIGLIILLGFPTSGCTLKASTESSTDTSINFTSSTTPGVWFNLNGLLHHNQKINAFLTTNHRLLQQEMAQGEGEYLTSLGTLLNISSDQMTAFKTQAQNHLEELYEFQKMDLETVMKLAANNQRKITEENGISR